MSDEDEAARAEALQRLLEWLTDRYRLLVLSSTQEPLQDVLADVPVALRALRAELLKDLRDGRPSDAQFFRWLRPFDAAVARLQQELLDPPDEEELRRAGNALNPSTRPGR